MAFVRRILFLPLLHGAYRHRVPYSSLEDMEGGAMSEILGKVFCNVCHGLIRDPDKNAMRVEVPNGPVPHYDHYHRYPLVKDNPSCYERHLEAKPDGGFGSSA